MQENINVISILLFLCTSLLAIIVYFLKRYLQQVDDKFNKIEKSMENHEVRITVLEQK